MDEIAAYWGVDAEDAQPWGWADTPVTVDAGGGFDWGGAWDSVGDVARGINDIAGAYWQFRQQSAQAEAQAFGSQMQRDMAVTQATARRDIAQYNAQAAVRTAAAAAGVATAAPPGSMVVGGRVWTLDQVLILGAVAAVVVVTLRS